MKLKNILLIAFIAFFALSSVKAQLSKTIVAINGTVVDEVTNKPVDITLEIYNEDGKIQEKKKIKAANEGKYYVTGLSAGKTYRMTFNDPNYFAQEFEFKIPNTDKYQEFSKDFKVSPKQKGMALQFKVVPFELNKGKLRAGSNIFLKDKIDLMKKNNKIKFEIVCFPDNDKDAGFNKTLTDKRAESLKDFFVANGIGEDRISAKGESGCDPKNPPPAELGAKGKRYIGSSYIIIKEF